MLKRKNNEKGFTIIEVVLVLAIAGLIFLVVFLALPALQRSQRDTQRKNDASRMSSQMTQYQSNNKGQLPANQTALNTFVTDYMLAAGDNFVDPTGKNAQTQTITVNGASKTVEVYEVKYADGNPSDVGIINFTGGKNCDGTTGSRNFAIRMKMEGGGQYCTGS